MEHFCILKKKKKKEYFPLYTSIKFSGSCGDVAVDVPVYCREVGLDEL